MRSREITDVGNFNDKQGNHYVVQRGWSSDIAETLPVVSRQHHIIESTPRDASERFFDTQASDRWYDNPDKLPDTYTLRLGSAGMMLGGLLWLSRQENADAPGYQFTSGFRLYEGAVGKGLATPFSKVAHEDFAHRYPGDGVWLETDEGNIPARKLYDKLGYTLVANNEGRLVMVWRPDSPA